MDQPAVPMKIRASIRPASSTFGSSLTSADSEAGAPTITPSGVGLASERDMTQRSSTSADTLPYWSDAASIPTFPKLDCDEYQGYYFSKPVPATEFRSALEKAASRRPPRRSSPTERGVPVD